jgi:methanogen homoaconitase small subunit
MSNIWKFGADVDTDQIVPGRYAPYMRPNDELGDAAFIEARPDFNKQAVPDDIIVATDNFGCGSSREYAPQALKRRQVGAIFANSFARIFYRNAINLGIPVFVDEDLVQLLLQGDQASLDLAGGMLIIDGETYDLPSVPNFAREIIDAGGIVPYVREHGRFPNS